MANFHLIVGEDDFQVDEFARRLIGPGREGLEEIDSANSTKAETQLADIDRALESFANPPFLEPRKVTWWRHVHFLPASGVKGAAEEVKAALERLAEKFAACPLPDNQQFILSAPRLLKTSVFAKRLAAVAELVEFRTPDPRMAAAEARQFVTERAAELKLTFAAGVAEQLLAVVGSNRRSLASELDKLDAYLGAERRQVTAADVEAVASPGLGNEPEFWAVADAVAARDLARTLDTLASVLTDAPKAIPVLSTLERTFRQLLAVKRGDTAGLAPFVASKYRALGQRWTERELRVARWRFLSLRERAVSGTADSGAILAIELTRTLGKAAN